MDKVKRFKKMLKRIRPDIPENAELDVSYKTQGGLEYLKGTTYNPKLYDNQKGVDNGIKP
jgi:hypothetical protein